VPSSSGEAARDDGPADQHVRSATGARFEIDVSSGWTVPYTRTEYQRSIAAGGNGSRLAKRATTIRAARRQFGVTIAPCRRFRDRMGFDCKR
jgi:hypothetical protein